MKRVFTTLFMLALVFVSVFAQAPQKMNYQAVVRNANNSLVTNQNVAARISILQGSATGSAVYIETQTVATNANGLITLSIGEGTAVSGTFSSIDWANGPYFLKSEIDPNGGVSYSIESVQQLLSVPYALYANEAGNSFSGDYNDLTNTPTIPTVPTNVSAFTNDAGYITMDSIPAIPTVPTNVSAFTNDAGYITMDSIPAIPTVPTNVSAFTNDAGYITMDSIPAIPTVPTNVSSFTNDAGYLTEYSETDPLFSAWGKDYNDLTNTPVIPTVPTNVSAFTNDAGYITMDSIPTIPTVPTNVSAFTNDAGYITMDSVPAIPTNVSAFTNDAGYLTFANVQEAANIPTNVSAFNNDAGYITMDSIPEIPTVPTNVSAFTNDAGYITMDSIPAIPTVPTNVTAFNNDAGYITMDSIPTIPTVPTNVGAFTNDAGYITMDSIPAIPAAANDATLTIQKNGVLLGAFSANAADDQTVNITVPTQTSQLENNSGFITLADVQQLINALNNRIDSLENVINGGTTPPTPEDTVDGGPCPGHHTVTDIDGNTYNTVQIGEQCWMKENLRTRKYPDGTDISFVNSGLSTTVGYCYYPNGDSANVTSYGYLYNWFAAMHGSGASSSNPSNVQGICPAGWHLPSYAEWIQLVTYVRSKSEYICGGLTYNNAKALSSTTGWEPGTADCAVGNDASLNNQTGFSAMPAGTYNSNYYFGNNTSFWSSTERDGSSANTAYLASNSSAVQFLIPSKAYGYSVRCVLGEAGSVVVAPSVTTMSVREVSTTTATCDGVVTQDGGSAVTARGVCWSSTSYNPSLTAGQYTVDGSGTGSFVSHITGLNGGTTYRVWAYATNAEGTTFGESISITTTYATDGQPCSGAATVTDVDGNVYNTIMLGGVCWMKENLRTTKFADGTPIALGTDSSSTVAYRYYPNNDSANVATYGYLYNWSAFIYNQEGQSGNTQGVCPTGWHIPKGEMAQLANYVSGQADYICGANPENNAKAVASTTGWSSSSATCVPGNDPASNNATGFNLPPAGYYIANSTQGSFGVRTYLWRANNNGTLNQWPYGLYCALSKFTGSGGQPVVVMKTYGYSVRCVRN